MAQFNLKDYEEVKDRIPKFLSKYESPRIITHLISSVESIEVAVFKAELFDGDKLLATGHAFERAGEGFVNKSAHLENCETSAIGRALANIGIHGDKRPSKEEMVKATTQSEFINEKQLSLLNTLISKHGINRDDFKKFYKVDSCKQIKWKDFSKIVKSIEKKYGEA